MRAKVNWNLCTHKERSLLKVTGVDSQKLLQGLITNDMNKLSDHSTLYTAFLNPKGRFLFDSFIYNNPFNELLTDGGNFILETSTTFAPLLFKYLNFYKLRSNAKIELLGDKFKVQQIFNPQSNVNSLDIRFADPRSKRLGYRVIQSDNGTNYSKQIDDLVIDDSEKLYHNYRRILGIIEGEEMEREKTIILDVGFDQINGISFTKGCYVGQELMSRVFHTGVIRKCVIGSLINPDHSFFVNSLQNCVTSFDNLNLGDILFQKNKNDDMFNVPPAAQIFDENGKSIGKCVVCSSDIALVATRKEDLQNLKDRNESKAFVDINGDKIPLIFVEVSRSL